MPTSVARALAGPVAHGHEYRQTPRYGLHILSSLTYSTGPTSGRAARISTPAHPNLDDFALGPSSLSRAPWQNSRCCLPSATLACPLSSTSQLAPSPVASQECRQWSFCVFFGRGASLLLDHLNARSKLEFGVQLRVGPPRNCYTLRRTVWELRRILA